VEADFHNDINIQMNYWPAEVCNLSECATRFSVTSAGAYRKDRKPRAICITAVACISEYRPTFGIAQPGSGGWTYGRRGGMARRAPVVAMEYSLEKDFLRDQMYPFYKLVAEFYEIISYAMTRDAW